MPRREQQPRCLAAVIWIDWYPYHVARFRGLMSAPMLQGAVQGVELVGGVGVHRGLKFREELPRDLPIETLLPQSSWSEASQGDLARRVWQRLNALQPEVVLVPGYYTLPAVAAALWARLHGRTSVLMTESTAGDHPRSWWKELPKSMALRALFDWAVTGGKAHVRYLRQLGFPADRIVGCYDVVDNALFRDGTAALRAAGHVAKGEPSFLYVGRLAEEKNVFTLLRAWAAYRRDGGRWPLVLCGDGPERKALEAETASSGYGAAVQFTGLRSSRELLPLYAEAGCFVLPSSREPWGLVANEAMAAGLPVLLSERCGCTEDLLMEGENGFRFNPFDAAQLQALLHRMEALTPEARSSMGQRSAERIARYAPTGFGEAIAAVVSARKSHAFSNAKAEVSLP